MILHGAWILVQAVVGGLIGGYVAYLVSLVIWP